MIERYCDAHCDTAMQMYLHGLPLDSEKLHCHLPAVKRMGKLAQVFAFCTTCWKTEEQPQALYRNALANLHRELELHSKDAILCGNSSDVFAAWDRGVPLAVIPALEGAEAIHCDPGLLEEAARDGIRMISLVWNHENALGGSHVTGGGLTAQGREFVRRAQKLGILIDVSHGSDALFYDVCEISERPIIASHSNSRAVCAASRNLTDDMFRCLVELGGCAGTNLYGPFLQTEGVPSLDSVRKHLEHFLDLGGAGHLCLGGDWDGMDKLPDGVTGVDGWPKLIQTLSDCGWSERALSDYASETFLRVLDAAGAKSTAVE